MKILITLFLIMSVFMACSTDDQRTSIAGTSDVDRYNTEENVNFSDLGIYLDARHNSEEGMLRFVKRR